MPSGLVDAAGKRGTGVESGAAVNCKMTYMTGVVAAKLTPDRAEFLDVTG